MTPIEIGINRMLLAQNLRETSHELSPVKWILQSCLNEKIKNYHNTTLLLFLFRIIHYIVYQVWYE